MYVVTEVQKKKEKKKKLIFCALLQNGRCVLPYKNVLHASVGDRGKFRGVWKYFSVTARQFAPGNFPGPSQGRA